MRVDRIPEKSGSARWLYQIFDLQNSAILTFLLSLSHSVCFIFGIEMAVATTELAVAYYLAGGQETVFYWVYFVVSCCRGMFLYFVRNFVCI